MLCYQDLLSKASQQTTADNFVVLWGCDVKCRTVGDILQQRENLISVDKSNVHASNDSKPQPGTGPLWFSDMPTKNGIVTDDILSAKTCEEHFFTNIQTGCQD